MAQVKERLDLLLVNKGFFQSRERAKAAIMSGEIFVDGIKIDKSGEKIKLDSTIEYKGNKLPYVSRGGLKLEKAINSFDIALKDKICLDIGASTGGFTDCMLQNDAKKVYAIDVGYGQFAWKLRNDPRVVCMERTNIRYVKPEDISEKADFASIDVSFISLKKVVPAVIELLKDNGTVVALIKPQFEAGREKVGKKGVVRELDTHLEVARSIIGFLKQLNLIITNFEFSPIKGPEGNIEYLVYFTKNNNVEEALSLDYIENKIFDSHKSL